MEVRQVTANQKQPGGTPFAAGRLGLLLVEVVRAACARVDFFDLFGVCFSAAVALLLLVMTQQKVLYLLYYLAAACFLLMLTLVKDKEKVLKPLFFVTIPFNVVKLLGNFMVGGAYVKPKGLESLAYFSVNEIVLLALLLILFVRTTVQGDSLGLQRRDFPFAAFAVVVMVSFLANFSNWEFGINELRRVVIFFLTYFYFSRRFELEKDLRPLLMSVIFTLFVEGAAGAAQYVGIESSLFTIFGGSTETVGFMTSDIHRIQGTFSGPNPLANFLVLTCPIALAGIFLAPHRLRLLSAVAYLLGCVLIFLTYSRGAWAGLMVQTVVFLFLGRKFLPRWLYRIKFWMPLYAVVFAVLVKNLATIMFRFTSGESIDAAASRLSQSKVAYHYFLSSPVFGIGLGNYVAELSSVDRLLNVSSYGLIVHNMYLKTLAELGLVGLFLYLAMYWTAIRNMMRSMRTDYTHAVLSAAIISGLIGHMVHNTCELAEIQDNISSMLFLLLAVAFSMRPAPPAAGAAPYGSHE